MSKTKDTAGAPLRAGIAFNLKRNNTPGFPPDTEAEFDDMDTIRAIQNALETSGCAVELYEATTELPARLIRSRPDIVFNIAEGVNGRGREAQVPALLNFLGIPFTGSDETALCVAMDKALTKKIAASCGINTPQYQIVKPGALYQQAGLSFPVIVKPNSEGSSKGISDISVAEDAAQLKKALSEKINLYKQDMLVEEFISGREFTVGILGNGDTLRVFSPMEIVFKDEAHSIYSYEVKRNFRQFVYYECPPSIDSKLKNEIENAALTIYRALECRDLARVDFRLSPGRKPYFIEINPLPGLAPDYSDYPMIAAFNGMDYAALIQNIMDSALTRYGL